MIALSTNPQCEPPAIDTNCRGASQLLYWPSVELGATMASCAPVMKHEGRWMEVAAAAADGFVSAAARVATGHLGTGTMWSQVPSEANYSRTGTRANACPRRPHDFLPCGSSLELELCLSRIACLELPIRAVPRTLAFNSSCSAGLQGRPRRPRRCDRSRRRI